MTRAEMVKNGTLEHFVYAACVLERAAEYCEGGWCQHSMGRDENDKPTGATGVTTICWCASGALICATHRIVGTGAGAALWNGVEWETTRAVERAIKARWPYYDEPINAIPTWNDAPGRTQAEVVETLNVAAQELRGWLAS